EFLIDLGVAELDRFDDRESLIFRENTLATKAIDEYMKLVGGKYLQDTLGEAVAQLCSSDDSCEVDPSKCGGPDLSDNQNNLRQVCEETLQRIAASCDTFPAELGEIFAAWQEECAARGKAAIGQRLVSASLFLRFLCPAIMSPSLFGLVQEYPSEATARTLTLVAKVIQNLANFTTFGEKEAYMGFMNEFLEHHWSTMTAFLRSVASPESSGHVATYDGYVDLALELATLHLLLCEIFSSLNQATQEELEPLPTILNAIREGTPVPVSVQLSSITERRGTLGFRWVTGPWGPFGGGQEHSELLRGRSKLRPSVSLPRKPTVPWQRYAEEVSVAQGELYAIRPLEKQHGRQIEALRKEVAESQERLRVVEEKVRELEGEQRGLQQEQGQHRELLERLRLQLEESNARTANLGARLTAAEGTRKNDLERLKASEDRGRALESRLVALEREHGELQDAIARLLRHPGRMGRRPQSRDEGGDEGQATSV
ncbi:RAS protein activator like-3-like, partial [Lagopus leucura]|uniref:RAS protein activator like-3-like n=1 Tax=Lagopus leucura TaxID=30410 RepID=UPI001C662D6B